MESFSFVFGVAAWVVGLALFVACFAASEVAYRLGRRGSATVGSRKEHYVSVQAMMAALLGLLLAFTVSMAVSRFESRKAAVVDESNAIGTAFLRASLLPEAEQSRTVDLFREYLDLRLEAASPERYRRPTPDLVARQSALQGRLWSVGATAAQNDQQAVTTGLYLQAVNEMIDSAGRRDAALRNHVPESLLFMIFAVALATLAVIGFVSGITPGRSLAASVVLSLVVAVVVFVILDFDRPYRGVIMVSQESMLDLRAFMEAGLPGKVKG
nr:hypothetical protein [Propionibacterium sp.]